MLVPGGSGRPIDEPAADGHQEYIGRLVHEGNDTEPAAVFLAA